jgi:acyl-CoA reductase-like NAD-dependent aldehyde dehydrogenase
VRLGCLCVEEACDQGAEQLLEPASTERALEVARRIRTGTVTINGSPISFDGPFGGYKASGTGREYGMVGLSEYLEHKNVTRKPQKAGR